MKPLELCFRVKPRQSQSGQIKNLHNQNKAIRPNQALGSRTPPQVFYRRRNCELDFEKRCPPLTLTASEMFIYFFLSFFPNSCSEIWSHDCSSSCSCHQQSRFAHRLIEDLLEDQFSIWPTRTRHWPRFWFTPRKEKLLDSLFCCCWGRLLNPKCLFSFNTCVGKRLR